MEKPGEDSYAHHTCQIEITLYSYSLYTKRTNKEQTLNSPSISPPVRVSSKLYYTQMPIIQHLFTTITLRNK